jgi:methyl-accepting chemotaxis protein
MIIMENLRNIKFSTRLSLGFGTVAMIGVFIALFGAMKMRLLADNLDQVTNNSMVKVAQFTELKENFDVIARAASNIILWDNPELRAAEKKKITELRTANNVILTKLDKTIDLPKGREFLKIIADDLGYYNGALDRAIENAEKGFKDEAAFVITGIARNHQEIVFKANDDSRALEKNLADQLAWEASEAANTATMLMAGLALILLLISAVIGWLIARDFSRLLGAEPAELSALVGRVAEGDLSGQLQVRTGDAISVMAVMARMQKSLIGVVSTVRQGSESVATASVQISQGNIHLSQRTEEQACALEETAASMEELSSTVKQNTDNAKQANHLAQSASTVAIKGGEVVAQVVDTMKGINDSSTKISDIISVIDAIAFQTNILALNAAVEAARAGEQGRGFAVVASEVRSLAGRSADAAKEIKSLITASVERVKLGTALADQAGATMTEVVNSIRRVAHIMGEISAASSEQSGGVSQMSEAVRKMDQVTQKNAALVEEIAAAASSLKIQAHDLVDTVAVFKLPADQEVASLGFVDVSA